MLAPMKRHSINQIGLILLLVVSCLAASDDLVEFTVVDRIHFAVPGNWPVIASKSTKQKTVFAFQVPNAADAGTSDSTNLSIISTFLRRGQDKEAFNKNQTHTSHSAEEKKLVEGWRCSSHSATQGTTPYVVWDCHRVIADSGVSVRMAWPQLPSNPTDYDNHMEAVLSRFLTSVGAFNGMPKIWRRDN
jgi:hypothetical protein